MDNQILHLILIIVVCVIIADMIAHPPGTGVLFKGFQTAIGIVTNPTNNGNGF